MTRLAYILAASHSGSTLLAMLLGTHPDVCTVGELKATSLGRIDEYRCSCGSLLRQCEFWVGVRQDMLKAGYQFEISDARTHFGGGASAYQASLLKPLHRGPLLEMVRDLALWLSPGWRRRLSELQLRNAALARCICQRAQARVIVDSSKIGMRLKYLLRNQALDVTVVRLVRDGRAVALTYTDPARFADASRPELRGGGTGASRDAERLTILQAAREWRRSNEEAEEILRTLTARQYVQVRYEDLCTDPDATLGTVFQAIGLDPRPVVERFRSVPQHVIGNGMRLDSGATIRLDERWRTTLTDAELRTFESVAGRLNARLGYR